MTRLPGRAAGKPEGARPRGASFGTIATSRCEKRDLPGPTRRHLSGMRFRVSTLAPDQRTVCAARCPVTTAVFAMSTLSPSAAETKLMRTLTRVLDTLDKWDERLTDHYAPQRKHARTGIRKPVIVRIPVIGSDGQPQPITVDAWMRNVSPGGMSFVCDAHIEAERILVAFRVDGVTETWYHAELKRAREVIEGYWEYGVAFRGKAS